MYVYRRMASCSRGRIQCHQKERREEVNKNTKRGMNDDCWLINAPPSRPSPLFHATARAVVDMRALQMLKVISMRENRGQGLKLHLSFEVWHLKTQIDRLKASKVTRKEI